MHKKKSKHNERVEHKYKRTLKKQTNTYWKQLQDDIHQYEKEMVQSQKEKNQL